MRTWLPASRRPAARRAPSTPPPTTATSPSPPPPPRVAQVQTVLGIFDLRGFTSANADWGFVRFLVDIFFLYYPKARCAALGRAVLVLCLCHSVLCCACCVILSC